MKLLNLRANRGGLAAISLAALVSSGCALRYTDSRSGAEHLWGMGELRMKTDLVEPGELVAVTTGSRVPGLCVDIGRDNFGLSFGWLVRQRTVVVETNELAARSSKHSPLAMPPCTPRARCCRRMKRRA